MGHYFQQTIPIHLNLPLWGTNSDAIYPSNGILIRSANMIQYISSHNNVNTLRDRTQFILPFKGNYTKQTPKRICPNNAIHNLKYQFVSVNYCTDKIVSVQQMRLWLWLHWNVFFIQNSFKKLNQSIWEFPVTIAKAGKSSQNGLNSIKTPNASNFKENKT